MATLTPDEQAKVIAHLRREVEHALLVTNALIASPVLPAHNRIMVRELNQRLRQEVESWRRVCPNSCAC